MPEFLAAGKLPGDLLQSLIATYVQTDESVIIGPEVGADAAALRVESSAIVVKSDPITFPTPDIARYLVNVNANDIACMGGAPRWMLVTALLPAGEATTTMAEDIFRNLAAACTELDVTVVGGHTEITDSVIRPVLIGMLIGEAQESHLYDLRRSQPGDALLLANTIAVEGTAILASEAPAGALAGLPRDLVAKARDLAVDPGISVVPAARALSVDGVTIRGMHDPTEGGIATALLEVATVSGHDIVLNQSIPIREDTAAICAVLGLDPLGLIASGALLAVVDSKTVDAAQRALSDAGIAATNLGTLQKRASTQPMVTLADGTALPHFPTDEIARYFSSLE